MVRVQAEGVFQSDAFYDALDEAGIMAFQELMGGPPGLNNGPVARADYEMEVRGQVRRLARHPSVVLWCACNECGGGKGDPTTYALTIVTEEDSTRAIWPASPAHFGWKSGVNMLTGMPNGLALQVGNATNGGLVVNESHGPYQFGGSDKFIPTNGAAGMGNDTVFPHVPTGGGDVFIPSMLPTSTPQVCHQAWYAAGCLCGEKCAKVGAAHPGEFASEFGVAGGMSSFEAVSATLSPAHWGLHANHNIWAQRDFPCDNLIASFWGVPAVLALDTDPPGEATLKRQLYQCMMSQALFMKADIESRKTHNTWGLLTWQLTDFWPAGQWGSVETGAAVPGAVVGGRWKPLHHWQRQHLFTTISTAVCDDGRAYVRNDDSRPFVGSLNISAVHLLSGKVTESALSPVRLGSGAGTLQWINAQAAMTACPPASCVLISRVYQAGQLGDAEDEDVMVSENVQLQKPPYELQLAQATLSFVVGSTIEQVTDPDCGPPTTAGPCQPTRNGTHFVAIKVKTDKVAVAVALTTTAVGYFSPNYFLAVPSTKPIIVNFILFDTADTQKVLGALRSTTRIEHLAQHVTKF